MYMRWHVRLAGCICTCMHRNPSRLAFGLLLLEIITKLVLMAGLHANGSDQFTQLYLRELG